MKISPIRLMQNAQYAKCNTNNVSNQYQEREFAPVPSSYYTPFLGGRSMDLGKTKDRLKELDTTIPFGVEELIDKTLEAKNPDNKTLIDIHKEHFGNLNEMIHLDDAKYEFPELFSDVLSTDQVDVEKNSFLDRAIDGKVDGIDPDGDISLQLLQLYWGEGFSLSTLKEKLGDNVHYAMKKLNIPLLERNYARYLKLSDKDYNERFSKVVSERMRTQAERRDGVYIPRGAMSDEHKAAISEGLRKYFAEHPERTLQLSERQKEFYNEHPEQRDRFAAVIERAWGHPNAKSIKKQMRKRNGGKEITSSEITDTMLAPKNAMKEFWDKNPWAKDQFQKCLSWAWSEQKKYEAYGLKKEPDAKVRFLPAKFMTELKKYASKKGVKIKDDELTLLFEARETDGERKFYEVAGDKQTTAFKVFTDFVKNNLKYEQILKDTYYLAIEKTFYTIIKDKEGAYCSKEDLDTMIDMWHKSIAKQHEEYGPNLDIGELAYLHRNLALYCIKSGNNKVKRLLEDSLNSQYEVALGTPQSFSELDKEYGRTIKLYTSTQPVQNSIDDKPPGECVASVRVAPTPILTTLIRQMKRDIPDIEKYLTLDVYQESGTDGVQYTVWKKNISDKARKTVGHDIFKHLSKKEQRDTGDAMMLAVVSAIYDLQKEQREGKIPKSLNVQEIASDCMNIIIPNNNKSGSDGITMGDKYADFLTYCFENGYIDIIKRADSKLDEAYRLAAGDDKGYYSEYSKKINSVLQNLNVS